MLGTVAHDLKNPLGVILGRAEILKEITTPLDKNVHIQIDRIRDSAKRLTGMLDGLVASAMADALDITIKREAVDVAFLIQEVVEGNRPIAARKGQTVTFTGRIDRPVICDPERIREAIDNLLSNAVKYSPIGGAIDVSVGQEADSIAIEVRDTGPGFSKEDMSRLFGRFQRLSAKPTAGESSTGLGLSIVKRIIDLHGGRITVQTAGLPTGATFRMTLPAIGQRGTVTAGKGRAADGAEGGGGWPHGSPPTT